MANYSYFGRTPKCMPPDNSAADKREAQALRNPMTNVRLSVGAFLPKQPDEAFISHYTDMCTRFPAGDSYYVPDQSLLNDKALVLGYLGVRPPNTAGGRLREFIRAIDAVLALRTRQRAEAVQAPLPWHLRRAAEMEEVDAQMRRLYNIAD